MHLGNVNFTSEGKINYCFMRNFSAQNMPLLKRLDGNNVGGRSRTVMPRFNNELLFHTDGSLTLPLSQFSSNYPITM